MTMCILEIKDEDDINEFAGRGPQENPGQSQGNVPDAPGFERGIIRRYQVVFPEDTLVGTSPRNGKRLVLVDIDGDIEEFVERTTTVINDEQTGEPVGRNLQWRVMAREDEQITVGRRIQMLAYFDDVPVFEIDPETGEPVQTGTEPVTDLQAALSVWFGKRWIF